MLRDGLEVTAARRFLTIHNRCLTPVFLLLALCLLTTVTDADAAIGQTTTEFTPTQFHIQTDEGDNRFFKYQTWNGSFRKEVTLEDGSVVGSYGWVDANGMLRITEYVSDSEGYRVTATKTVKVGEQPEEATTPEPPPSAPTTPLPEPPTPQSPPPPPTEVQEKPEISNEINDEPFLPILRPFPHRLLNVKALRPLTNSILIQPPVFPSVLPVQQVRQLPVRRKFTDKRRFGVRRGPLVLPRTPSVAANINALPIINNKDDILFLPGHGARVAKSLRRGRKRCLRGCGGRANDTRRNFGGGRRLKVVKRRRHESRLNDISGSVNKSVDYMTGKAFHREVESDDGSRSGEYGWIDPIGVRRVVEYTTGPRRGIKKKKENDYVGPETYFEAS